MELPVDIQLHLSIFAPTWKPLMYGRPLKSFHLKRENLKVKKKTPLKHKMKIKLGRQWRRLFTKMLLH